MIMCCLNVAKGMNLKMQEKIKKFLKKYLIGFMLGLISGIDIRIVPKLIFHQIKQHMIIVQWTFFNRCSRSDR